MKCGLLWFTFALTLLGCTEPKGTTTLASNGRVSPEYPGPPEAAFCSTTSTFSDPVTITGSATFNRREVWGNSLSGGLGGGSTTSTHPATNHPIRQAEVRVTDPSGSVVQCAATDDSGAFSFSLPRGNVTYTVSVNSRADNSYLRVSVLNQPERNQFYSLSTTVQPTASKSLSALLATANGDTLGGAFNIMDEIYEASIYLRSQVSSCAFPGCLSVNSSAPLPKVTAYWTKGFNPNTYFGATSGLSFYMPGYSRLFILGGKNGLTDTVDTDHFDASVIIHEYGHFLEDVVGNSDSPGGSHDGNRVIDARLAWSEGWGDFFQAAVRNDNHYIDTIGNDDGTTDMAFYVNLETASSGADYPNYQGEGNFREFSITRLLWDVVDSASDTQFGSTDGISGAFADIWGAFSSSSKGLKNSVYSFRNIGLLHSIQSTYGTSSWSALRLNERQDGNEGHYGQTVSTTGCSAGGGGNVVGGNHYYFATVPNSTGFAYDGGVLSNSDQFRNNLFFRFIAPSAGTHTITLTYQDADGVVSEADLDLYVYNDSYRFADTSTMLGYSRADASGVVNAPEPSENVVAAFSAGANYMVNVSAYTGGGLGTQAYFNIYYDGNLLCPANIVP